MLTPTKNMVALDTQWPCGLMDKALVFGTKDCRFESCQGHTIRFSQGSILVGRTGVWRFALIVVVWY